MYICKSRMINDGKGVSAKKGRSGMLKMIMAGIIISVILGAFSTGVSMAGQASSWKVGRAVVQPENKMTLKLSLRNEGGPSKEPVRIFGRWSQAAPGKSVISPSELGRFTELGSFAKEVELKQTAILEIPLASLGAAPQGKAALEIAVMTRQDLTDGQVIPVH